MMGPESEIAADKLTRLHEVLGWTNDYVKEGGFLVGNDFTLADIIFVASYSTMLASGAVDLSPVSITITPPLISSPDSLFILLVCRAERVVREGQAHDPKLRQGQRRGSRPLRQMVQRHCRVQETLIR